MVIFIVFAPLPCENSLKKGHSTGSCPVLLYNVPELMQFLVDSVHPKNGSTEKEKC